MNKIEKYLKDPNEVQNHFGGRTEGGMGVFSEKLKLLTIEK